MILDRFSLTGKVAIVTGAGLGIGRGIAIGFAEAGADVVLAARTAADLEEVAGHVRALGRRALVVPTDVTDAAACEALVAATVGEFGRLDILVNNAGGAMPRAALDTSEGFMARTFAFNVTAPLTLTKLAARQMVDTVGSGAVVNISSRSASMTQTMFVAYGAAKAALDRMTRNIAPELAPRVRVNAIDVGGVATRSLDIVLTDDGLRQQFLDGTPMGRPGEPEDIACAVLYLASDASSWVTGKVFEVDGGTEAPAMTVPAPALEPTPGPPPPPELARCACLTQATQPLTECSQVWATAAGCPCCAVTSRFSLEMAVVVTCWRRSAAQLPTVAGRVLAEQDPHPVELSRLERSAGLAEARGDGVGVVAHVQGRVCHCGGGVRGVEAEVHLRPVVGLEPARAEARGRLRRLQSPVAEDADEEVGLGIGQVGRDTQVDVVQRRHGRQCPTSLRRWARAS